MNPNSIENVNQKESCYGLCSNKDWPWFFMRFFIELLPAEDTQWQEGSGIQSQ